MTEIPDKECICPHTSALGFCTKVQGLTTSVPDIHSELTVVSLLSPSMPEQTLTLRLLMIFWWTMIFIPGPLPYLLPWVTSFNLRGFIYRLDIHDSQIYTQTFLLNSVFR